MFYYFNGHINKNNILITLCELYTFKQKIMLLYHPKANNTGITLFPMFYPSWQVETLSNLTTAVSHQELLTLVPFFLLTAMTHLQKEDSLSVSKFFIADTPKVF